MGVKLIKYYQYIEKELGLKGKYFLAGKTKIPSILAATSDDSEEVITLFREAIEELTGVKPPIL